MRITERQRLRKGLKMIEEISADAQSTDPRRSWRRSHAAVCGIYEIVHSLTTPKCRRNHPGWVARIDAAVRGERAK